MVNAVFTALVAIRTQLPHEALDCSVRVAPVPEAVPNCELDAERLGANYGRTAAVVDAMSADTLKHPDYIETVVRDFFERAVKAKYLKITPEKVEQVVKALPRDGKMNGHQAVELIMSSIIRSQLKNGIDVIDIGYVLSDLGRLHKGATGPEVLRYIGQYGKGSTATYTDSSSITFVVKSITSELLRWNVPVPISETHQKETEDDKSPIRAKEIEIRVEGQRDLIRQLFGTNILFAYNDTKDSAGFAKEIEMDPTAEPKIPKNPSVYYATYSLKEKNAFDHMVFHYIFPSLDKKDLELFVRRLAPLIRAAKQGEKLKAIGNLTMAKYSLDSYIPIIFKDLAEQRLTPKPDDFYYRNAAYFEEYRQNGTVKPLLGPADIYQLEGLLREAQEQLKVTTRL